MAIDVSRIKSKIESFKKKVYEKKDNSASVFTPIEGKSYDVRIVPAVSDPGNPFLELYMHHNLGIPYSVVALDESIDPVTQFANKLRKSASKEERDYAYPLLPKPKFYVPIIVRGEEDKGVRLFSFNKTLLDSLMTDAADIEQNGDIIDVNEGSDFTLTTEKKPGINGGKPYLQPMMKIKRKPSVLSKDAAQIADWLENQPSIHDLFEKKTVEELKELLKAKVTADTAAAKTTEEDDEELEDEDDNADALASIFPPAAPVVEVAPAAKATKAPKTSATAAKYAALFE